MISLYLPALITAFVITLVEMTEVVALVFALSAEHTSARTGTVGAIAGTALVSLVALGFSAVLIAFPRNLLLWASALVLAGFGVFLYRSTHRSYRRQKTAQTHVPASASSVAHHSVQFAGGFTVGVVEAIETVIVLIALAAAGFAFSALLGAVLGGVVLVGLAAVLHEQVRRIKVPSLKWFATSLLFAFALFWGGEAAGFSWPGADLFLIPLVLGALVLVRGAIELSTRGIVPVETKS